MNIEVKPKLDYESYRDFFRFTLFIGKGYKTKPILFFTILPLMILLTFYLGVIEYFTLATVICFFSSIIWVLYLFLYFKVAKTSYEKSKPLLADEITYRFYDDYVESDFVGKNIKGIDSYQYTAFKNIYKVNSAFYLMLINGTTLIIPKRCLDMNQINYLSTFLSNYFGDKYKNCF